MTRPEHDDPERYAELTGFDGDWRDLWWNRDFVELMLRRLDLPARPSVLDVGCGAGHWGRTLLAGLSDEARLTGVDREPHFLGLASDAAKACGIAERTEFVQGDATSLPFPDDSFDLVTCQTVLIHVHEVERAIAQMRRVAKPGGVVLAVEPDNLAGNTALLGGDPSLPDADVAAILRLQLCCEAGKRALGEGDNRVGARLPGLFANAGLRDVRAFLNDRCIELVHPYERPAMATQLRQELDWSAEGISILLGNRAEAKRLYEASSADPAGFEELWSSVERWMALVRDGVAQGRYHAARGFVMVLTIGRG